MRQGRSLRWCLHALYLDPSTPRPPGPILGTQCLPDRLPRDHHCIAEPLLHPDLGQTQEAEETTTEELSRRISGKPSLCTAQPSSWLQALGLLTQAVTWALWVLAPDILLSLGCGPEGHPPTPIFWPQGFGRGAAEGRLVNMGRGHGNEDSVSQSRSKAGKDNGVSGFVYSPFYSAGPPRGTG